MIRRMRWWKRGLLLVLTIFLATKAGNQMYLLCYRVYADREAQNRVPLQLPQDDKLPPDGFKTPLSSDSCITRFVQYRSSQYELYWKNVWEASPFPTEQEYCKSAYADESAIANWLRGVRALNRTRGMELPPDVEPLKDSSAAAPLFFSEFVYEVHCAHSRPSRVVTRIEPLAAGLRHPKALCEAFKTEELAWTAGSWLNPYRTRKWFKQLVDRDYLVLEGNESASFMRSGQSLLLDLGASTWNTGLGGASQKYLVNHYHNRGIDFNRILLWESTPMTPAKVFKDVPPDVMHSYQFFNLPASSNATSPANPWNILRRISRTEDFVSVKLDIDHHPVEMEFVQQLLEAPELLDLVDELFFEHHVNFQPLRDCCWRFGLLDHRASVLDTYNLFLWLRNRGVRAHGWP